MAAGGPTVLAALAFCSDGTSGGLLRVAPVCAHACMCEHACVYL